MFMQQHEKLDVKQLVLLAVFTALAYTAVCLIRIPAVAFLSYEPKDVIIVISGFIFGPLSSLIIALVTSFLEMITISDTGPVGAVMNLLSSSCYACTAAMFYKYRRTLSGAVAGLAIGSVVMVLVMLLWNWLITPLYMGVSRDAVVGMLVPMFLPFNAVKALLNSALVLCLYKPLITALRKTRLIAAPSSQKGGFKIGIYLRAAGILATGILLLLVLHGII
jgi:riboflavin transporter FmnP